MFKNYTKEQFIEAVANSTSVRQVLFALNLKPAGGNYRTINELIKKLSLDISHFTGKAWNKGKSIGFKRSIEDYLSNKFQIGSHELRLRLIREGYFNKRCYSCELSEWKGLPIPLELEHKDGNHYNNNLNNLTLLCPNCHAQTSTYRGRKKRI